MIMKVKYQFLIENYNRDKKKYELGKREAFEMNLNELKLLLTDIPVTEYDDYFPIEILSTNITLKKQNKTQCYIELIQENITGYIEIGSIHSAFDEDISRVYRAIRISSLPRRKKYQRDKIKPSSKWSLATNLAYALGVVLITIYTIIFNIINYYLLIFGVWVIGLSLFQSLREGFVKTPITTEIPLFKFVLRENPITKNFKIYDISYFVFNILIIASTLFYFILILFMTTITFFLGSMPLIISYTLILILTITIQLTFGSMRVYNKIRSTKIEK